ncbi:hypothetical protein [Mechercharimyces sp. CAU 1602]|uniref:hypothetical protein n=1 Tax=Mechercharimyces sp. CAU 1602 TaxID=2973933 RepID=UPI002161BA6F|nr:hypothetical protein [Mechercharimyces sp. CAU 1602]MCS1349993.1 hypothetical protein [Mechercharimyces sp. CAU 1602]
MKSFAIGLAAFAKGFFLSAVSIRWHKTPTDKEKTTLSKGVKQSVYLDNGIGMFFCQLFR